MAPAGGAGNGLGFPTGKQDTMNTNYTLIVNAARLGRSYTNVRNALIAVALVNGGKQAESDEDPDDEPHHLIAFPFLLGRDLQHFT